MKNLSKSYSPKNVENRIYKLWLAGKYFTPKIPALIRRGRDRKKKPYTIVLPPPNITGNLHMGHALNATIQDILIRYNRMQGFPTLWLPGTDHAGIGMQTVVEKELNKQGLRRQTLGRKEFEKKLWAWKDTYGKNIVEQIKKIGCSCDWSRERFTMDKDYQKAVSVAFIHYYKKGYIYRGYRLINWCPRCQTVLSDLEVEYKKLKSYLWYIRYPIKDQKGKYITVATTRPETMLGDTAVAVNPKDKKYKNLIGQKVILPLVKREITIIADSAVDMKFGTGAVKVTPAHDPVDYELGEKYGLEKISVIGFDGKMTSEAGEYEGLSVKDARELIIKNLKKQGLLEKTINHEHSVGTCQRCGTVVEPLISKQWFVNMKKLADPATLVVKKGKIKFIPVRWDKIYLTWMKNIKDWCISRQLWWGHQIPVWYCDSCDFPIASIKKPTRCPKCKNNKTTQDPDVLDTWFSSALWPFATLGWPDKTKDLSYFYPTSTLVTAKDIIYLWVARMIFSGLEFTKQIPFSDVFINATVLDSKGKKMSKSKGNIIDPMNLIENFGADATRFGLIFQTAWGQDMSFQESRILTGKKFCNKIWNASRFVIMNLDDNKVNNAWSTNYKKDLTAADKKILAKLVKTTREVEQSIKKYRFGQTIKILYDFFWHDFCDTYIETTKNQLNDPDKRIATQAVLFEVLESSLKLLHPFIPFVTEEIWQELKATNPNLFKKYYNYQYRQVSLPKALVVAAWPNKGN